MNVYIASVACILYKYASTVLAYWLGDEIEDKKRNIALEIIVET